MTPVSRMAAISSATWRGARLPSVIGAVALTLAIGSIVLFPVTYATVVLAAVAVAGLSFDRRLGPIPAAVLVVLALPYDRAANNALPRLADIPIRPHDVAILVGLALSLPALRRANWRGLRAPQALAILAFLLVGVAALIIGYLGDQALRDILRDARWWALYGSGLVAILLGVRATEITRAILVGGTIFAVAAILVAALPAFEGGLKLKSLEFDRGLLRMQFGNTTMLLIPIAAAVVASVRRPSGRYLLWLGVLVVAGMLSLTRTYILVAAAVVVLATIAAVLDARMRPPRALTATGVLAPALAAICAAVLAVGLAFLSLSVTNFRVSIIPDPSDGQVIAASGEDPLERLLFQTEESGLSTLGGGRFETYRKAASVISEAPVIGSGLGTLMEVSYSFGGEEFDTPGFLPNVDNAWLTVGMKAGLIGIVVFGVMLLSGLIGALRGRRWLRVWLVPAMLGLGVLTLTQSFSTTGYGPFVLGLLIVLPVLGYTDNRAARARAHEYST